MSSMQIYTVPCISVEQYWSNIILASQPVSNAGVTHDYAVMQLVVRGLRPCAGKCRERWHRTTSRLVLTMPLAVHRHITSVPCCCYHPAS